MNSQSLGLWLVDRRNTFITLTGQVAVWVAATGSVVDDLYWSVLEALMRMVRLFEAREISLLRRWSDM